MSLPRRVRLANVSRFGYDMISSPYDLSPLYAGELACNSSLGNGSVVVDYSGVSSGAIYFRVNASSIPTAGSATGTLNFTFSAAATNESVSGGYFLGGDAPFWLERGKVKGFDNVFFTDKFSVGKPVGKDGVFVLEGVIDRSILEVFLDEGESSATTTFYPAARLDTLKIAAGGLSDGVKVEVSVWGLKSAWEEMEGKDGLVRGNVTAWK